MPVIWTTHVAAFTRTFGVYVTTVVCVTVTCSYVGLHTDSGCAPRLLLAFTRLVGHDCPDTFALALRSYVGYIYTRLALRLRVARELRTHGCDFTLFTPVVIYVPGYVERV